MITFGDQVGDRFPPHRRGSQSHADDGIGRSCAAKQENVARTDESQVSHCTERANPGE
jgi:hypothetical protein